MNEIPKAQVEAIQLDRLAAQRSLYLKAKQIQGWQLVLSVPCVIVWSFVVLAFPALRSYAALWGIVVTLLDSVALDRWQKNLKERAARVQELFDCDVLELTWPELKGQRPDAELIAEESSRYLRTDPGVQGYSGLVCSNRRKLADSSRTIGVPTVKLLVDAKLRAPLRRFGAHRAWHFFNANYCD